MEYLMHNKQYEKALKMCNKSLSYRPYQVPILYQKSVILKNLNKPKEGLKVLEKAYQINHKIPIMKNNYRKEKKE